MSLEKQNEKREKNLTKARNKKCEPIAEEILRIIAKNNELAGEYDHKKSLKVFGPIQVEINKLMKEKELTMSEFNYTWSIVETIISQVKNFSNMAVQHAFNAAECKLWEVDEIKDVTLQNIDNVLQ